MSDDNRKEARRRTLDDVFVLEPWNDIIEDGQDCAACVEPFEAGQRAVYVDAGFGPSNAILLVHLWCAVQGDEIDLTYSAQPTERPIDWKWYGEHGWTCMGVALSALEAIASNPMLPNVQRFAAEAVTRVRVEAESIKDYRR